jgi:hypothetical protein
MDSFGAAVLFSSVCDMMLMGFYRQLSSEDLRSIYLHANKKQLELRLLLKWLWCSCCMLASLLASPF